MRTGVGSVQDRQSLYRKDYARAITSITTDKIRAEIDALFGSGRDVAEIIEDVARLSARLLIQTAVEAEVDEFLGGARTAARPVQLRGHAVVTDRIFSNPHASPVGDAVIRGIAASRGTYTGPARIVTREADFDKIRVGDVLVCPVTSPVRSVVFPSIGALVTDEGGILSHPAIIAREYGIPAVVHTRGATRILRDGEPVRLTAARARSVPSPPIAA